MIAALSHLATVRTKVSDNTAELVCCAVAALPAESSCTGKSSAVSQVALTSSHTQFPSVSAPRSACANNPDSRFSNSGLAFTEGVLLWNLQQTQAPLGLPITGSHVTPPDQGPGAAEPLTGSWGSHGDGLVNQKSC